MMNRREFAIGAAAGAFALGARPATSLAATPTQNALVMDAMGEIREVYTDELCQEMIDSGLNSVTVTLCDPKSYETQAYEWAMSGLLDYDRLIEQEARYWLKATTVADIDRAHPDPVDVDLTAKAGSPSSTCSRIRPSSAEISITSTCSTGSASAPAR